MSGEIIQFGHFRGLFQIWQLQIDCRYVRLDSFVVTESTPGSFVIGCDAQDDLIRVKRLRSHRSLPERTV